MLSLVPSASLSCMIELLCWGCLAWFSCCAKFVLHYSVVMPSLSCKFQHLCQVCLELFSYSAKFVSHDSVIMSSLSCTIQLLCWLCLEWFSYVKFVLHVSAVVSSWSRVIQLWCWVCLAEFSLYRGCLAQFCCFSRLSRGGEYHSKYLSRNLDNVPNFCCQMSFVSWNPLLTLFSDLLFLFCFVLFCD